jgi:methylated-DNA-[protein]-cysteine S-methyltransferase
MDNKLKISDFQKMVYAATQKIPKGKVATYGWVARAIGFPNATRAIGNALNKNPFAPRVPCHRVIKSNGSVGGFADGTRKKIELLKKEGIVIKDGRVSNGKYFLM